jgi:hypothetical protein
MVQKLALTGNSRGMRLGKCLTSWLFFASMCRAVHERKLHVKFQGILCCGRSLLLMKTIHKVMGSLQNLFIFKWGKLSMALFSGFVYEVTKHVMYFIVAVVLGTFLQSQKAPFPLIMSSHPAVF